MTNYDLLLEKVRALGMDYRWAKMFVKKLKDDEEAFPASEEQKKWAMERGFYPGRVELYGLTEENWRDYMADYPYFMMHPLNNHFLKWLDKTTLKYVLNSGGAESTMPEYYVYIENELCGGTFTYLMDCPQDIPKDEDFLLNLLKQKKVLAMKPNSGTSGGLGFIKLELRDDGMYENNRPIGMERFIEIREKMRNYIVTEYCKQHHELAAVWPDSECTLRVIMCKNPGKDRFAPYEWNNVISYARLGTSISGGTSNLSTGGVGVSFDFETGKCNGSGMRYRRFTEDGNWWIWRHPDTGVEWKSLEMPNWPLVREKIDAICRQVSSLDYIGLDIIITEDGMKLCEINSHPALDYAQLMSGPAMKKENVRRFFERKGFSKFDGKDFYRAYMESQE
ncbi:MAG: hypothetical protein J5865_08620 [Lachnospiraceae bacterium]|nr:hypothetical protein [Lachnospiraceae bacterium]